MKGTSPSVRPSVTSRRVSD